MWDSALVGIGIPLATAGLIAVARYLNTTSRLATRVQRSLSIHRDLPSDADRAQHLFVVRRDLAAYLTWNQRIEERSAAFVYTLRLLVVTWGFFLAYAILLGVANLVFPGTLALSNVIFLAPLLIAATLIPIAIVALVAIRLFRGVRKPG